MAVGDFRNNDVVHPSHASNLGCSTFNYQLWLHVDSEHGFKVHGDVPWLDMQPRVRQTLGNIVFNFCAYIMCTFKAYFRMECYCGFYKDLVSDSTHFDII